MLFRRFLPGKHQAIFATIVAKLPPVVVVDGEGEEEGEDEDGTGGSVKAAVVASERAYAKLSSRRSDNERRWGLRGEGRNVCRGGECDGGGG